MQEIDYLLRLNAEGVLTFAGNHAVVAQVREWLDTPRGQVWGKPYWGNLLSQFKHMPINDDTASSMEAFILLTIGEDLPNARIDGIRIYPTALDLYRIILEVGGTVINEELAL